MLQSLILNRLLHLDKISAFAGSQVLTGNDYENNNNGIII